MREKNEEMLKNTGVSLAPTSVDYSDSLQYEGKTNGCMGS